MRCEQNFGLSSKPGFLPTSFDNEQLILLVYIWPKRKTASVLTAHHPTMPTWGAGKPMRFCKHYTGKSYRICYALFYSQVITFTSYRRIL